MNKRLDCKKTDSISISGKKVSHLRSIRGIYTNHVIRAREENRQDDKKYFLLFENMNEGIALLQIAYRDDGTPSDYIYTEVNSAFETITGIKKTEIIGRFASQCAVPSTLIDAFNKVVSTGEPVIIETYDDFLKKHFRISAFSPDKGKIAAVFSDISQQKLCEQNLEKSEQQLATLFQATPVGIFVSRLSDGMIIDANEAFSHIVGFPIEEVIGRTSIELNIWVTPREREECIALMYKHGILDGIEIKFRRKNSTIIDIQASILPIEHGVNHCILGTVIDITDRKKSEVIIKEGDERLRAIFQSSPDGFAILDRMGTIVDCNKMLLKMLGFTNREDIIGRSVFSFISEDDRLETEQNWKIAMEKGILNNVEYRIASSNREKFPVNVSASTVADAAGKINGLILSIRDITAAKKAEEAVKESQALLRAVMFGTTDPVYVKDRESRILLANPALAKIVGKPLDQIVGKTDCEYYGDPGIGEILMENDRNVIESGRNMTIEETVPTPQGYRTFQSSKAPYRNSSGEIIGIIGISRDITEQKVEEEILKQDKETFEHLVTERTRDLIEAQTRLANSKRLSDIGTLSSTVAHELRNPLAVISIAAENIRRKIRDSSIDSHLEHIRKKIMESNQLITNLLFYSRLRNPQYENVNIRELVLESVEAAKARPLKNMTIRADIDSINDITIDADPLQIKEVFTNLLNNAQDAIPEDGGRIEVSALAYEESVILSFMDNGQGIPVELINKIFEPFFTTKSKGTGLGMTVCNQVIDMHGGKIEIWSEKDKGTEITVILPIKKKAAGTV
jgi:PAS domain S-box-containing protein